MICFQYKFINQMLWPITMLQASIHEKPGCWGGVSPPYKRVQVAHICYVVTRLLEKCFKIKKWMNFQSLCLHRALTVYCPRVGNTSLRGGKLTSTNYLGFRMVFDGRKCRHIFSKNFCLIYDKKFNLANITSYRILINRSTEFSISRPSLNSKQTLNCIIGHWCGLWQKSSYVESYSLMN